ncbi:Enoyl-CoA hydratase 2, peroxisomal-like protein [Hapsidospora chrysogenum ATCC 11550]|uniref:Enoyl-CoA hydratase 2, peroxisomal-like protein n=1 Tax=Hapsidospora chrysogenum (strain ATCC 11550 / CBS 779.69 / DSM 880 / IAM 14645 / JCM 23072 / IMI 49137) TaxID=857340 RepID=A0A086TFA4_HAPC1|nr:Enoyl-CoA hydratase 2, peroxisomal-like protein [Hapsidospora chrysogenum ATCC 11550]
MTEPGVSVGVSVGVGVGFEFPPRKVSWLKRDTLLFNLSIGCKADEPQFVYLNTQEVIDFHATQGAVRIPGVPDLDPARLVDGDRTIQILKPLPVTSQGRDFEFRSRVLGVYDKGKGGATVLDLEDVLVDAASGDVYARNIGCLFYVGQGGWGGPRRGPARARKFPPPEGKAPDLVFELQVDEQAAHLYRLNGDYNPLHATPEYGDMMGYGGIIMHGVYAYNRIAHEIVRELGAGDPASLREMSARFAGPVKPGDRVRVELWKTAGGGVDAEDGWMDVRWAATVDATGRACLTGGRAVVRAPKLPSKI